MDSTAGIYSSSSTKGQRSKVGRPLEACDQCQRRKQKCNREWPCRNCRSRKVAHLCQFRRQADGNHINAALEAASVKRRKRQSATSETDLPDSKDSLIEPVRSFRALGYMEVEELNGLCTQHQEFEEIASVDVKPYPREIEEALNTFPHKTHTDVLIRHALEMIDYVRVTLYPSQVLDQYEAWWPTRVKQKNLDFSSLILRLCSLALQCLPENLRQHVEDKLGDNVQFLTERYHNAARKLSDYSELGFGGLIHVQQLFLTAAWLKGEGFFDRAWHSLGAAIREAQELGIHREVTNESVSEMDRELRRRIWCSLYIWDRFMSITLRRPYLIDDNSNDVHLPSPNLEMDTEQPGIPSPIVEQLLKYRAAQITVQIAALKSKTDFKTISMLLEKLHGLQDSVPSVLKLDSSRPSVDTQHPRLVYARYKILLDFYVSIFILLKQVLFLDGSVDERPENSQDINKFRKMACEYGVRLIELTAYMAEIFNPEKAKDHQLMFTPFDTAMTLCVALQKNSRAISLSRSDIVIAIGQALCTLTKMEGFSILAKQGARTLRELVASLSLTSQEKSIILVKSSQQREIPRIFEPGFFKSISSSNLIETSNNGFTMLGPEAPPTNSDVQASIWNTSFENGNLDIFTDPLDLEWRDGIDLGILDDVFHWDDLLVYES